MTDPAVSVLLPTLNRRALVTRAVASVLAQTRRDFEVVIIDGGSSDGTHSALEPVLGERVRLLTVPGIGVAAARNEALRRSTGRIVAFLDSDNYWRREHLAVVCGVLDRHPEAVLVSTSPNFEVTGRARPGAAREVDLLPELLVGNSVGWVSAIAVRRSALETVGGFDERLVVGEDADLWRRLALQGRFALLRRKTVTIQRTVGSLSDRARAQGLHFEAFELSANRMVEEVCRSGRRELLAPAQGAVRFAQALRAVMDGNAERAQTDLRKASRLLPDLSRRPGLVLGTIDWFFPRALGPPERLRVLGALAAVWPEQASDTTARLRAAALAAAIRARRPVAALVLLRGIGLVPSARLALWLPSRLPYHLRRAIAALVHRGRETANVRAGAHVA